MCPWCDSVVDVTSRHVAVVAGAVRTYCSAPCLEAGQLGLDRTEQVRLPRRRRSTVLAGGLLVAAGVAVPQVLPDRAVPPAIRPTAPAATVVAPAAETAPRDLEAEWIGELAKDAWVHPLRGVRRMPVGHGAVFGAERPGDRPVECISGHCGVDLGGEVWGEPIVAAHDGVVDRVRLGPNEEHGGVYVRIAHRDATVFTQYFHLAAVPRGLRKGSTVRIGQVIGLLGDTGVKHAGAHLHFTISVKPAPDVTERYIDPEPLIALWPLLVPETGAADGAFDAISISAPPGLPKRGARQRRKDRRASREAESALKGEAEPDGPPEPLAGEAPMAATGDSD